MTNETEAPDQLIINAKRGGYEQPKGRLIMTLAEELRRISDLSDAQAARIAEYEVRLRELEAENRELAMQCIASDGQAQMAYEEQVRLEAKLAKTVALAPEILASLDATGCNVSLAADYRATLGELKEQPNE